MNDVFTVCKVEAGRALLMSQDDFELIEVPAKLLPKDSKTVRINIQSRGNNNSTETEGLLGEIKACYGVGEREIERFKEEIGSDAFLTLSKLGCTAAIVNWSRPFHEIFKSSIKIDAAVVNIDCPCTRREDCYCEGYVDYVRKGLKPPGNGTRCRINLPIDLKVSLLAKTSVGYFKSNEITLKSCKFEDFSGVFLVSDQETASMQVFREKGGTVGDVFDPAIPITAIIVESTDSELFRVGIENNLPVVAGSWVEALLSSGELPEFENHLVKERK